MTNAEQYEERVVKILDAVINQEIGTDDNPDFIETLILLLQDVETRVIFQSSLSEPEVRRIIGSKNVLTSKAMIDLAILLRQREEPIKLMVPQSKTELSVDDILKSKNLDQPKKNRSKNYRNRKRRRNNKPPATVK